MSSWIQWCSKCNARILTTEQAESGKNCFDCQKEQAMKVRDKVLENKEER